MLQLAFALLTSMFAPQDAPAPVLVFGRTAAEVSFDEAVQDLAGRDVVFLGEEHDSVPGHEMELKFVQALHKLRPDLVISMEMFERDVQGVLDDYLAGRISEEEFTKHARPWPHYAEHYRPIIEYAKKNNLDVIAGNVPRRIASDRAKGTLPAAADQVFVPRSTSAPEDAYWTNFQGAMGGHGMAGHGGGGHGDDAAQTMRHFYAAQCLKDDAMAEAIADYLAKHAYRTPLVVHLCGKFHSDAGLGTVARLVDRAPLLQIGVVSMETLIGDAELDATEIRRRAHYIIKMRKPAEKQAEEGAKGAIPTLAWTCCPTPCDSLPFRTIDQSLQP